MTKRARCLLLVVATWPILLIGLLLMFASQTELQEELILYSDAPLDAALLRLDKQALDDAYYDQLKKLFAVWLSQQAQDPRPISNGLAIARRAYRQAASQIAARERELERQQGR